MEGPIRVTRPAGLALALLLVGCAGTPRPTPDAIPAPSAAAVASSAPSSTDKAIEPTASAAAAAPGAPLPAGPPRIRDGRTLFARMAAGFRAPVCVRGEQNRHWRQRFTTPPTALENQLRAAMPLMAFVVEDIETRGLPMEFALIPLVESGYRPDARGRGGPLGLWQLMGSTARAHGVVVDAEHDGRLSPAAATQGALDHLAMLQARFGDWRAAAMAYNAGEGRLRRALARAGSERVSAERRWPGGLSPTTYAYVAKLRALACLIRDPQRHGLVLPGEAFIPYEPALHPVAPRARRHTVAPGDSLWRIARRHGTSVRALAAANGLRVDAPLAVGRVLRLPD